MIFKEYRYIDLFAGSGGLSLGLHHAGWRGVFAIEKSPDAFATLNYNLIEGKNHFDWPTWLPKSHLDINQVIVEHKKKLKFLRGEIDLVVGGPPCQGFSIAGRRKESDFRNSLIKSYIEFIRLVQPKILFFENVKGFTMDFIKNKDKGVVYSDYVVDELHKLGYYIKSDLINFGNFGVPQKRIRFLLVGIREDIARVKPNFNQYFFSMVNEEKKNFIEKLGFSLETNLGDAISDLNKSYGVVESPDTKRFTAGIYGPMEGNYQKLMRGDIIDGPIDSHRFANHREDVIKKFDFILNNSTKNKHVDSHIVDKFSIKKHRIVLLDKDKKSPTITSLPDDYIHYNEPRILTVREYARIQTFPDWYKFKGRYTTGGERRITEVPRYTQIGNAIPPLFAQQIGNVLKTIL